MMAEKNQIPQKSEKLLERDIDDEIVVMSPKGDELYTFVGSARFIWSMIDGVRPIDDILARVTDEYQVEASIAQRDLETFIAELRSISLLKK
jgi:hypothetical protein